MHRLFSTSFKRTLTALIAAVTLLAGVQCAAAAGGYYTYAGYTFAVSGQNAIISEYEGTEKELYIPQSIFGYTVIGIEDSAFFGRDDFTSLSMTDAAGLKTIGNYAFYQCSGVRAVKLPDALESIGTAAFMNCSGIETLSLSKRMTQIPDRAFCNCSALSEVDLPDTVTSLGPDCFGGCTALSRITIPNSVSFIDSTAFQNDDQLVIYCYTGSYAQTFAQSSGYRYELLDAPPEPPTEVPADTPTEPFSEAVEYLGDTDGDGEVEIGDAAWIQRQVALMDLPFVFSQQRADADGDGNITLMDAALLQRWLSNLKTDYAIGKQLI